MVSFLLLFLIYGVLSFLYVCMFWLYGLGQRSRCQLSDGVVVALVWICAALYVW